jgi:hypothetical protein
MSQPDYPSPRSRTIRLHISVPAGLHQRFKMACARADLAMQAEVLAFIERRTKELEGSPLG